MEDRPQNAPIALAMATKSELDTIIHSKQHFEQLFAVRGGFYLPPTQFITWGYIRSVLKGDKKLLKMNQIQALYKPPKVSELTVSRLFEQVRDDNRIMQYLPESSKPQDKQYFFTVLACILPDFYVTVLENIAQSRKVEMSEEEKVEICPAMGELLAQGVPYFGTKEKVGQYLNKGRKWGSPGPRQPKTLDLRRIF